MKGRDVVQLVASELGLFCLEQDGEGGYAVRMVDGHNLRIFLQGEEVVIMEYQLMAKVTAQIRSPERLMELLLKNFIRAIQEPAVLTYLKELDEFALSLALPHSEWEEQKISEQIDNFLADVQRVDLQLQQVLFPSGLPSNPYPVAQP
ncbi:MAG: type III secretion system chaperone [Puniceicoccales bacterium]|nr:type III secretion system chaperone [Puniceicoccales bacterium]